MNERIKQLAEQAGLKVNADGEIGPAYFGSVDAGYRKFAELIVQECENAIKSVPTHFEAQDIVIVNCLKSIRETFRS
jgi:hypothetical protein